MNDGIAHFFTLVTARTLRTEGSVYKLVHHDDHIHILKVKRQNLNDFMNSLNCNL